MAISAFCAWVLAFGLSCSNRNPSAKKVLTGADLLIKKQLNLVRSRRIGLITNHSALLSDGTHLADALARQEGVRIEALFAPEHGIRGDAPDGGIVQHEIDTATGAKVFSLFGLETKPTAEMLKDIDVLVFDVQDIGARFYTFISTLFLTMEAAAEHHLPYIVLDRPNPIGGVRIEGPVREDPLKSFVGWAPLPVTHGLTVGELARMANGQGWLKDRARAELTVVKMEGWKRALWYDETGLRWVKPSPSMLTLATAVVYPGACFIEGTNVSEGRGTERPFEFIGAPWIDANRWAAQLERQILPGVRFEAVAFTPKETERVTVDPKYEGEICRGVSINVIDRNSFQPVRTGIALLWALQRLYPEKFRFRDERFDRLAGTARLRQMVLEGRTLGDIVNSWEDEVQRFKNARQEYLLYK